MLHLRQDGRRHAPGLGGAGRDDDHLRRVAAGLAVWRGTERQPRLHAAGRRPDSQRHATRAATWKARRRASASPTRRCGQRRPPPPRMARSTRCTTRYTPLGGLVPLLLMQLGEVIYGGVGSGLYGMLAFVIVAVFIAGLMVGRTPEYLGKKIEAYEMKMASLMILIPLLVGAGRHGHCGDDRRGQGDHLQPRRARLQRSAVCLLLGGQQQRQRICRAGREHAVLQHRAAALPCSSPATGWRSPPWQLPARWPQRRKSPPAPGTLPTHTPLFIALADRRHHIVGALSFLPALALGPIVEHLMI